MNNDEGREVRFSVALRGDRWAVVMDYHSHCALAAVGGRAVQLADGDYPSRFGAEWAAAEIGGIVREAMRRPSNTGAEGVC